MLKAFDLRLQGERGATMVEFAFSAFWFFLLLVVIMESSVLGWRALTAQFIASNGAREAALYAGNEGASKANVKAVKDYTKNLAKELGLNIGPSGPDPYAAARQQCQAWTQSWWWGLTHIWWVQYYRNYCNNLPPPPTNWDSLVQVCTIGDLETNPTSNRFGQCQPNTEGFGDPNDFVVVRVAIPTRYFFQRMIVPVVGEAASRNEK